MGLQYTSNSRHRGMMLELVRMEASSCTGVEIIVLPGTFRPQNWRIGRIDVLAEDYGAARDKADWLEAKRHWIVVPKGHLLDGQVDGREEAQ